MQGHFNNLEYQLERKLVVLFVVFLLIDLEIKFKMEPTLYVIFFLLGMSVAVDLSGTHTHCIEYEFSRWQIGDIFLNFPRKQNLTFQNLFSEKKKKNKK